eukprot:SM000156S02167  [mRNA]  locus=s156:174236:178098:- [translate_table: standard]
MPARRPTLALLGAGLFVKDQYVEKLRSLVDSITVAAVWSRSKVRASNGFPRSELLLEPSALNGALSFHLRVLHAHGWPQGAAEGVFKEVRRFSPAVALRYGEAGLQLILDDKSIDAVAIVLPALVQSGNHGSTGRSTNVSIVLQPDIVVRALRAGKHVIQEKPVAASMTPQSPHSSKPLYSSLSVQKALETLEVYKSLQGGQHGLIWAVAENYRFEAGLMKAAELVKELGKLMMVELFVEAPMNTGNRYYSSQWRRDPDLKGAFMIDGGVHFIGGLRLVSGCETTSVCALATHVDEMLPPPDNLAAIMQFDKGCTGAMIISWSATSRKMSWRVVGENGTVEAERGVEDGQHGYTATSYPARGTPEQSFHPFNGVQEELQVFAEDVAATISLGGQHQADSRSSPLEAIRDLAIVEAMLQSGEKGGSPVAVVVPS